MIASRLRPIKPGAAYSRLITPSLGEYIVRRSEADTSDTLKLIKQVIAKTLSQTEKLAPALRGNSLMATCENIWQFVYTHIQYKIDRPGHEEIRHPARIWADRVTGVDCDDYTVMISSILSNLRIPHKLRITDYGKGWQHIYVVVPKDGNARAALDQKSSRSDYITLDCVTDRFDHEVAYTKNQDSPMTLNELNGIPAIRQVHRPGVRSRSTDGLGNIFQKIGQGLKKAANAVKKVATTPLRLGILAAMKLNFPKAASNLRFGYVPYGPITANAKIGPAAYAKFVASLKRLIKVFVGLGGDHNVLFRTILNGKGNKDKAVPLNIPNPEGQDGFHGLGRPGTVVANGDEEALAQINSLQSRVTGVAGLEGLSGGGLGELGVVAETAIAAAAAILVPIIKMMSGAKADDPNDPVPPELLPADDDDSDATPTASDDDDPNATTDAGTSGFGALAKKKAAAKRVKTAVAKQVAKGKPVTAAHKAAAAKAAKVAPKELAPKAALQLPVNTASMSLPTTLPGLKADGSIPGVTKIAPSAKAKKAAKKAAAQAKKKAKTGSGGGLIKKVGTAVKSVTSKLAVKKKVASNAKKIKDARDNGDHATAAALEKESAKIVQQQANSGSDEYARGGGDDPELTEIFAQGAAAAKQASTTSSTLQTMRDKITKAVDNGTLTLDEATKLWNKTADSVKNATGKQTSVATQPIISSGSTSSGSGTDDDSDGSGYDAHQVVSSQLSPASASDSSTADDSGSDTASSSGSATGNGLPFSTPVLIGLGVGALVLGKLLLGSSSAPATRSRSVRSASAAPRPALSGTPRRKKSRKSTSTRKHSRVHLQD